MKVNLAQAMPAPYKNTSTASPTPGDKSFSTSLAQKLSEASLINKLIGIENDAHQVLMVVMGLPGASHQIDDCLIGERRGMRMCTYGLTHSAMRGGKASTASRILE